VKEHALDYARTRAEFGRGQIRVLNKDGSVKSVIPFDEAGKRL